MRVNRRIFIGWVGGSVGVARAQVIDLNDAINKAGRQRMLSQRVAKAYLCLGQKVQVTLANKALEQSMALFDRQLVELKSFVPAGALRDTYAQLEAEWSTYKSLLVGTAPSVANAAKLLAQDGKVLELANKGTGQLEQLSKKPAGKLVNIAGRQRMLSQRLAKYYYAMAWNLDITMSEAELTKSSKEFVAALETLRNAPQVTDDIKAELVLADGQWVFFDHALKQRSRASDASGSDVYFASENLLLVMDKVTGLYARLER